MAETPNKSARKSPAKAGGAAAAAGGGGDRLTERELEILSKAWSCMKTQPEGFPVGKIDMPKLAAELGMTNVGSATNAWGRIKKKLFIGISPAAAAAAAAADPPGSARKRKAGGRANPGGAEADDGEGPAKKARPARKPTARRRGKGAVAGDDGDDDDEEDRDDGDEDGSEHGKRVVGVKVEGEEAAGIKREDSDDGAGEEYMADIA